jgi:hypothetical protein
MLGPGAAEESAVLDSDPAGAGAASSFATPSRRFPILSSSIVLLLL